MVELLGTFFDGNYMPHGHCYLWQPHILWVNVISDLIIAAAYFSIPIALITFVKHRPDIEHRALFVLFSAFILLCGVTHLMGIITIWKGVYGLHGLAKLATAIVSMITAISLFRLMPKFVKLPTIEQYEGIVNKWSNTQKENEFLSSQIQSQKLTQFVLDSIPISLLLIDEEGDVLLSNSFFNEEFNGNKPLVDVHVSQVFQGNSIEFKWEFHQGNEFQNIGLGEQAKFLDNVMFDGHIIPVEVVITKKEYQEKNAFVITIKDLREITQIKQMLVESNSRFERAVRATEEGLWEWELLNNKMIWSPKFYEIIGAEIGTESCIETWLEHIHPDYKSDVTEALNQHLKEGDKFFIEYVGKNGNGEYGWFTVNGNSLHDHQGAPTLMSGSLRYIEDEKQKEQKYLQKNRLLNAIYEGSNYAILVIDVESSGEMRFNILNDVAMDVFGVARDKLIHTPISDLKDRVLPADFVEQLLSSYRKCVETKSTVAYVEEVDLKMPLWFQTTLSPVLDNKGEVTMIIATAIDITDLKTIETKLAENSDFLENLVNNSVSGMYIYDVQSNRNILTNKRYEDLLGYSQQDLNSIGELDDLFHPDELELVLTHTKNLANSKDGELIALEYRFKHKNGNWVWCYTIDSILLRNDDGSPKQVLGTFIDVTEKNQLLMKLKESNQYLERFAFVASHDLQEPLRKISAFSESLSERLLPQLVEDEASTYELSRMKLAAKRMSTMIHDLLQLSRINSKNLNRAELSLAKLIDDVKDILELALKERQAVITYDESVGNIMGDSNLLVQLMQNIFSNSLKFCAKDKKPTVHIHCIYGKDMVDIVIQDNGIGIDKSYHHSIFEPFRRLHGREEFEGSGIGLSIVNQIVQIHDGTIRCDSELGRGSKFTISLPRG